MATLLSLFLLTSYYLNINEEKRLFQGIIKLMAANKKIKSLTSFVETHTRRAASPLCPTCLRPLFKSYEAGQEQRKLEHIKLIKYEGV